MTAPRARRTQPRMRAHAQALPAATRTILALALLCACKPSRYEVYADFEAEEGGEWTDCGYLVANPPIGQCLTDDDLLPEEHERIACLRAAWEACDLVSLDGIFRLESGEYVDKRIYVNHSDGRCNVVEFSDRGDGEMIRRECEDIAFFPDACFALEVSHCVESDRIPIRQARPLL